jgi:ribonuclease P protein component
MSGFAFPKQARLRKAREFTRVYREGRRETLFPLRFCVLRRDDMENSRLGLAIGRKVGGAVVRNRWKRAIREAFRLNRRELRAAYDMVVSVSWEATPDNVKEVGTAFGRLIEGLNELKDEKA